MRIDLPTAFVSLPMSGTSKTATEAGVFLLSPSSTPLMDAARIDAEPAS